MFWHFADVTLRFSSEVRSAYASEPQTQGWECDFIVRDVDAVNLQAIQVCWTLTTGNRERELRGLLAAMEKLSLPQGLLLTYDEEESLPVAPGRRIAVMPVWKWLLAN